MLITIIVPVYNSEKYLKRCMDSLLGQTYCNMEIILVDDGSTDRSPQICQEYAYVDKRVILVSQENKGPAAARNVGLKIARGEYIGFVDSDDCIEKDMYNALANIILRENVEVLISNIKVYKDDISYSLLRSDFPIDQILQKNSIRECILKKYYSGNLCTVPSLVNKLYRRDFLLQFGITFDETRVRAEDYWFNFYVFKYAESVYATDGAYYNYFTQNEGSVMKAFRPNQYELFLKSKEELLRHNLELKFNVDWSLYNRKFIDNTNEYILLAIKKLGFVKGYPKSVNILRDREYQHSLSGITPGKLHMRLIKRLVSFRAYLLAYLVFYVWSQNLR